MMALRRKTKIYSRYEIAVINFYTTCIWLLPIVLLVTYAFELDRKLNIDAFILWLAGGVLIVTVFGTLGLLWRRDHLKRRVKPVYRTEYLYLIFVTAFGVLGFCVLYDYAGGDRAYIANILVVLSAVLIYVLLRLGRKFYNTDYMKKK
ncbi:MAG TPA: hypothetical protein PLZ76_01130 [Bacillota bacterium]|nr:hypothetical protein [Bacillota bacterium]